MEDPTWVLTLEKKSFKILSGGVNVVDTFFSFYYCYFCEKLKKFAKINLKSFKLINVVVSEGCMFETNFLCFLRGRKKLARIPRLWRHRGFAQSDAGFPARRVHALIKEESGGVALQTDIHAF